MANVIRIKRRAAGGAAGAPASLANAELAFNEQDNTLYYGTGTGGAGGTATSVIPIAGPGAFVNLNGNQTVGGVKTFTSTVVASISGNAGTATALQTARTINGVPFDGTANITISSTSANALTIGSYLTGGSYNGSAAVTVAVDATSVNTAGKVVARDASGNFSANIITAALAGNASTATTLATARNITLTGDATGTASFNGTADASIALTFASTGITAGTYQSVTVNAKGLVTGGTNPTTLSGFGITDAVATNRIGAANGVASLDSAGKVPAAQLPSFVDDVVESTNFAALPATGETSKIYVLVDTNKIYRWSGTVYVEISPTAGNADSATKLATARTISATGDANWTVTFDGSANATAVLTLSNSGVSAGSYGSATTVPSVTLNAKGLVTAASSVAIAFPVTTVAGRTGAITLSTTDISGLGSMATQNSNAVNITGGAIDGVAFDGGTF